MKNDNTLMNHAADNIRILAAAMVEKAKSGHPGGAMGGADFINVLYAEYLQYDPANPKWEGRDRFFLDPGHMSPMLYAQLAMTGKFTMDELKNLRQWGSPTPGHPEVDVMRGIENTSGPLGQGHVFAIGAAIAAKFLAARTGNPTFEKETIYAYISDGGIQEEISQGGGRIAGHLGLDNLIMFYDANDIQLSTETGEVMTEDTAMKYRSWGWHVIEINGNDCQQIRQALDEAKAENQRPTLIIGKCIMGKGARKADNTSYEHSCKTHGAPLGGDAYKNTILNLGGDLENPFVIFDDVKEMYARREEELKAIVAERHREEQAWAEANPEKAAQQAEWFSGKAPRIDWNSIEQKAGDATEYIEFSYHTLEIRVASSLLTNIVSIGLFEDKIVESILYAYYKEMDTCIIKGDGNGKPLGVTVDPRVTNSVTFTADEMGTWEDWRTKLFGAIPLALRGGGEFMFPVSTVEKYFRTMHDDVNRPLYIDGVGLSLPESGVEGRFNGRPVLFVEPDLIADFDEASDGDVIGIYWVPSEYMVNTNLEFGMRRYFDEETNQWVNKALCIVDGKMVDTQRCWLIKKGATE